MMDKYGSFEDFRPNNYFINEKLMIDFFVEDEKLFVVADISHRNKYGLYKKYNNNELLYLIEYSKKYIPAQCTLFIKFQKAMTSNNNDIVTNILKIYSVSELNEYIKYLNSEIDSKLVGFIASIFDPEKKERMKKLLLLITEIYQRALYVQGYENEYSRYVKMFL
jgi:hypothetical protein